METNTMVRLEDVKRILVRCNCGAEITVDLEKHSGFRWEDDPFPGSNKKQDLNCPICLHYTFRGKAISILANFAKWSKQAFDKEGEDVYLLVKSASDDDVKS